MSEEFVKKDVYDVEIRRIDERIDAAVSRIELKTDAAVARMENKTDAFITEINKRISELDSRVNVMRWDFAFIIITVCLVFSVLISISINILR